MGLFDDLDASIGLPEEEGAKVATRFDPILTALEEGWVLAIERRRPGQERQRDAQYQEVEVRWTGERFSWTDRILEGTGRSRVTLHAEQSRKLDADALTDALAQHPWVAQLAFEALGIQADEPDF